MNYGSDTYCICIELLGFFKDGMTIPSGFDRCIQYIEYVGSC